MKRSLEERLRQHPHLYARISQILDVVENSAGDVVKADEAERRLIEELRQLGQETLQGWAEQREEVVEKDAAAEGVLQRKEKKDLPGTPASEPSR